MAKKSKTTETETLSNKRPENYAPQKGVKASLNLADFEDSQLVAELRRRGYSGELRYSKIMVV